MKKVEIEPIEFVNEELLKQLKGGICFHDCLCDSRDLKKTMYAVRIYESEEPGDFYDFAVYDNYSSAAFCRRGIVSGLIKPKGLFK